MSPDAIKHPRLNPSGQTIKFLIIISVFLLLASVLSMYFNTRNTEKQYRELATVIGRSIFQEILIVRRWNAEHGGIYVPVTERFQPNLYLEDVRRDVTTADGMKLTKINPEYMTRLISELLEKENGIKTHITSLRLTSPANRPDEWEERTLQNFELGSKGEVGIVGAKKLAMFRYMAPLRTEEACMTCHAKQGDKVGDVRGGLSVSFSYVPFQTAVNSINARIYFVHIVFFLLGIAIVFLLGKRLVNKIEELQKALYHIKKLEGLLPICAHCKMIRKEGANPYDQASWVPIEIYVEERTDAQFTHGICPACVKRHYGFQLGE
jgi:hypothetical protein